MSVWLIGAGVWLLVSIPVGILVGNYLRRLVDEHYPPVEDEA